MIFNLPDEKHSVPARVFNSSGLFDDSDDFCEYRINMRGMTMMRKLCLYRDGTKFFLQAEVQYDDLRKVVVSCGILDRDNHVQSVEPFDYDFSGFCSCVS